RRQRKEALALRALRRRLLARREVAEGGRLGVDLHHERELVYLPAVLGHALEDRLPRGAAEEVVVDDEERGDAVMVASVPDPAYHRLRVPRAHRAAHHVLDAA